MVKKLLKEHKDAIHEAVQKAEQATEARLAVVVAPASDEYRDTALSCGLAVGSAIALLLWYGGLLPVPGLLLPMCIQLSVAFLWTVIPFLRHLSMRLVSSHVRHQRAARRAAAEYLHAAHHLPLSVPFVLLYVSLAERYMHIYSSRLVREKIPDQEWHAVIQTLTASYKTQGLEQALAKAVEHATQMLQDPFPASGK